MQSRFLFYANDKTHKSMLKHVMVMLPNILKIFTNSFALRDFGQMWEIKET